MGFWASIPDSVIAPICDPGLGPDFAKTSVHIHVTLPIAAILSSGHEVKQVIKSLLD